MEQRKRKNGGRGEGESEKDALTVRSVEKGDRGSDRVVA